MQRRAQLTIFIILGLLILIGIIGVVYIRSIAVKRKIEEIARPAVERIPQQFVSVKTYFEDCLRSVLIQGLKRIGQQGGYIEINKLGTYNFFNPTDSSGVAFSPSLSFAVPYWWHNAEKNGKNVIRFEKQIPPLRKKDGGGSIEEQLENYIKENIKFCFEQGILEFKKQGFELRELLKPKVIVTVTEKSTAASLDYLWEIAKGKTRTRISKFYTEVPLDLERIYNVALDITNAESNFTFLENHVLNLLVLFSGTSSKLLPPMSETTFKLGEFIAWPLYKVKQDIKALLTSYIPLLRVWNSKNFVRHKFSGSYAGPVQRNYDNMAFPPDYFTEDVSDLVIRFDYLPLWEPYVYVPNNNGIITATSLTASFPFFIFGINQYETVYDISFPVLVSIEKKHVLDGEDFVFNFALEGNIRNNEAVEQDQQLIAEFATFEKSLLCADEQKVSQNITIIVRDGYTNEPIEGATIIFSLLDESCTMGITDDDGMLITRFPYAYGSFVVAEKEGYFRAVVAEDIDEDLKRIEFKLFPYKELTVSVKKKKLLHGRATIKIGRRTIELPYVTKTGFDATPHKLEDYEEVFFTLERIKEKTYEPELVTAFMLADEEPETKIKLVPGKYRLSAQLLKNMIFNIPKREEEVCIGGEVAGVCIGTKKKYTIPEINLSQWIGGGLELTWTVKNNLYSWESIEFNVLDLALEDIPLENRRHELLEEMGKIAEYSESYAAYLNPRGS